MKVFAYPKDMTVFFPWEVVCSVARKHKTLGISRLGSYPCDLKQVAYLLEASPAFCVTRWLLRIEFLWNIFLHIIKW